MCSRARLVRFVRAWGFDRNPMRRPIDRVETVVAIFLTLLFLVVAPLVIAGAVSRTYDAGVRAEKHQLATRHSVSVTVLGEAGIATDGTGNGIHRVVQVSWRDHGVSRTATVPELQGDKAGKHRALWLDSAGRVVARPRDRAQTASDAVLAGVFALAATGLPIGGCWLLARKRLDRRRLVQWEDDWAKTAPRWIKHG